METELKLRFDQSGDAESFLNSTWLQQLVMPDSRVETTMLSRYFDTPDKTLTTARTSLRIRQEGDARVATIKLGDQASDGRSRNGLHQRQEWSVDLDDGEFADDPEKGLNASWFQKNAVSDGDPDDRLYAVLHEIDGQPLQEICQASFIRTAYDVGFGDTLMELALDAGELKAGELTGTILEIELELKEGDVRDLMELGEELKARFNLAPEPMSKYARCLALLAQQAGRQDG